ncbi:MAG: Rax2 family protein [Chloroflexota bacterium]|nr:Rax2 family protein [Chloroflexota bacterium]
MLILLALVTTMGVAIAAKVLGWRLPALRSASKPEVDKTVCGEWDLFYGPDHNLGLGYSVLYDVVAIADNDVWAIGFTTHQNQGHSRSLIVHWDGSAWNIVPSPEPSGSVGTYITDLVAITADDIWAVGSYYKEPSHSSEWTLTMHWDGEEWSLVPSPNMGLERNTLNNIAAVSSDDIWATGTYELEKPAGGASSIGWYIQTLHWDGENWTIVPSPIYEVGPHARTYSNGLSSLVALSEQDIWGFGSYIYDDNSPPSKDGLLVLRWNGKDWRIEATAPLTTTSDTITKLGLADTSATGDVWVLGQNLDEQTLLTQWDGTRWNTVSGPIAGDDNKLLAFEAIENDDVWAVGSSESHHGIPHKTLVLHWNGTAWGLIESPNALRNTYFSGVAATPSGEIWTVGYTTDDPYEPHRASLPRYALAARFVETSCATPSGT